MVWKHKTLKWSERVLKDIDDERNVDSSEDLVLMEGMLNVDVLIEVMLNADMLIAGVLIEVMLIADMLIEEV